jgi:hypothetical protein
LEKARTLDISLMTEGEFVGSAGGGSADE